MVALKPGVRKSMDVAATIVVCRKVVKGLNNVPGWVDFDDLFQEAMLAAILAHRSFDPELGGSQVGAWQYFKAYGAVRDYLRKAGPGVRQGAKQAISLDQPVMVLGSEVSTFKDQLPASPYVYNDRTWVRHIWKLVNDLTIKQATAFRLVYGYRQMAPLDAAKELEIRPEAMYQRLYEAKRTLRRVLDAERKTMEDNLHKPPVDR